MVKKRTQLTKQDPIKKINTRPSRHQRKISDEAIKENHPNTKSQVKPINSEKELPSNEQKEKSSPLNQDIDIYFASCISPTLDNKQSHIHKNEKNLSNMSLIQKSNITERIKLEFLSENDKQMDLSFYGIQQKFEEQKSQDSHEENQSPIFGHKKSNIEKYIPPQKLDELKIYDHSQEMINRDLMDQLEDGSKVSFISEKQSVYQQISSQNLVSRFGNHVNKKKKKSHSLKRKPASTFFPSDETEMKLNSINHRETMSQIRHRAKLLRLSCLGQSQKTYEDSLEALRKTSNYLKSVMYYYEVREYQQKVYSFRSNVFQVLNDEIKKLRNTLALKRQVCCETIQKKMKNTCHPMWAYDEEKRDVFENFADNLMK